MSWDKGLDYELIWRKLLRRLHNKRRGTDTGKIYASILLIQLRNGSRISEAIRAYKEWVKTRSPEVEVPVSKRKGVKRLMVVPKVIEPFRGLGYDVLDIDDAILKYRIRRWAHKFLGINTHSLRYAFITYLLKNGVEATIIAKITKHARIDHILTYTQEKVAHNILRGLEL